MHVLFVTYIQSDILHLAAGSVLNTLLLMTGGHSCIGVVVDASSSNMSSFDPEKHPPPPD